ncbi:hypothetical protein D3C83_128160 [compost metagenome]
MPTIAAMSMILRFGLAGVSKKTSFVFLRRARARFSGSVRSIACTVTPKRVSPFMKNA